MAPKPVSLANTSPATTTAPGTAPVAAQPEKVQTMNTMQILSINTAVPMPEILKNKRGSKTQFPFDDLTVGASFGVIGRTAKSMSSIVSAQNRAVGNQAVKKDAAGNVIYKTQDVKDAAGNVTKIPTAEAETVRVKEFFAVDVNAATDPEAATVRVFRRT